LGSSPQPVPSASAGGVPTFQAPRAGAASGGAYVDPTVPQVFWGTTGMAPAGKTPDGAPDYHSYMEESFRRKDKTIPAAEAVAHFWTWSEEERSAFGKRLYSAGVIDDPSDFQAMYSAWQKAVEGASVANIAGMKLTPWQVVDLWDGISGNHREAQMKTQTSYNLPSTSEAESAIRQIFRDKVGRDPDDGELSKYRGMLVRKAKENPSVSTTTYDAQGNATTSTSGGIDIGGEVGQMVEGDDDYGAFQAGVPLFNALISAIGAPV